MIQAARLNLLALGWHLNRPAFEKTLEQLRAGQPHSAVTASLSLDEAVMRDSGHLNDRAFVRLMFARALGGELALQPDAAAITAGFGSIEYWVDRLGSGISSRQNVLLSVFRLANARDLLLSEAQIVTLYRAFFNLLPDAGGIAYWRKVSAMPERLIEVLYYAPEFRRRFGG